MFKWTIGMPAMLVTLILTVSMLTACVSGPNPEEAALQKFQSIPRLPGSVLVKIQSGIDQGSQDKCYAGYVEALFGTELSRSKVIEFYRKYANDVHWTINEEYSDDLRLGTARQGETYYLAVLVMTPRGPGIDLYSSRLQPKVIDEALSEFNAVYLVTVSYTGIEFKRRCT